MTERYTDRERVLDGARGAVMRERNNQYGPPTQDFDRSADILNSLGYTGPGGRALTGHDMAVVQIAVKLSRITWRPDHLDSWLDVAGYAACGFECAEAEKVVDVAEVIDRHLPSEGEKQRWRDKEAAIRELALAWTPPEAPQ